MGTIRVIRDGGGGEHELARRTTGDVVGEVSIVTKEPRMATLVAEGDVRTVTLGRREFESMLRERPSIALAVMRVLAHPLAEDRPLATRSPAGGGPSRPPSGPQGRRRPTRKSTLVLDP